MAKKLGLAELLVVRGLLADLKTASAWIMARKVRVGDAYITKPGTRVSADASIEVAGLERRYVSRGGEKLEAALERFGLRVQGQTVLDAGASTGGFTHCLLEHGAARVYSVDVGFGQLRGSLAADPRVVALERTNIGDLDRARLDAPIALCVADLSYLSIAKSLPILSALFRGPVRIAHLVKPLFEGVDASEAADPGALVAMHRRLESHAPAAGLRVIDWMASPILGSNGTVEFFGLFASQGEPVRAWSSLVDAALEAAASVSRLGDQHVREALN